MTRTERIKQAIAREERKRQARLPKPQRPRKRHKALSRIRWDRPLPHEVRA